MRHSSGPLPLVLKHGIADDIRGSWDFHELMDSPLENGRKTIFSTSGEIARANAGPIPRFSLPEMGGAGSPGRGGGGSVYGRSPGASPRPVLTTLRRTSSSSLGQSGGGRAGRAAAPGSSYSHRSLGATTGGGGLHGGLSSRQLCSAQSSSYLSLEPEDYLVEPDPAEAVARASDALSTACSLRGQHAQQAQSNKSLSSYLSQMSIKHVRAGAVDHKGKPVGPWKSKEPKAKDMIKKNKDSIVASSSLVAQQSQQSLQLQSPQLQKLQLQSQPLQLQSSWNEQTTPALTTSESSSSAMMTGGGLHSSPSRFMRGEASTTLGSPGARRDRFGKKVDAVVTFVAAGEAALTERRAFSEAHKYFEEAAAMLLPLKAEITREPLRTLHGRTLRGLAVCLRAEGKEGQGVKLLEMAHHILSESVGTAGDVALRDKIPLDCQPSPDRFCRGGGGAERGGASGGGRGSQSQRHSRFSEIGDSAGEATPRTTATDDSAKGGSSISPSPLAMSRVHSCGDLEAIKGGEEGEVYVDLREEDDAAANADTDAAADAAAAEQDEEQEDAEEATVNAEEEKEEEQEGATDTEEATEEEAVADATAPTEVGQ